MFWGKLRICLLFFDCGFYWLLTFLTLDRGFRMWAPSDSNGQLISSRRHEQELQIVSEDCATKKVCFPNRFRIPFWIVFDFIYLFILLLDLEFLY